MTTRNTCGNCRHYQELCGPREVGSCMARPPQFVGVVKGLGDDNPNSWQFPVVYRAGDTCSLYSQKTGEGPK